MKKNILFVFGLCFIFNAKGQTQKKVSDCLITYAVSSNDNKNSFEGATKTVYIHGMYCKSDLSSASFSQSIIYNQNTNSAVILRTIGQNKYITKLDGDQWKMQNIDYDGMKLFFTSETKNILGYECSKAEATLKNGKTYNIWFATEIIPTIQENPFQFKDVPGLIMEYDTESGTSKINYTAVKINLSPLPVSIFTIPTTGYKELKPE